MTPFDSTCPRCAQNRNREGSPDAKLSPTFHANQSEAEKSRSPWSTAFVSAYLVLSGTLSFALMFCLTSLLFALLMHGIKMDTGQRINEQAKTGIQALVFFFVDVIKVGWFFGILGGLTSAYPFLKKLQNTLRPDPE